jgi:DNA phosphorothioation-dependent restriction protein DptG
MVMIRTGTNENGWSSFQTSIIQIFIEVSGRHGKVLRIAALCILVDG